MRSLGNDLSGRIESTKFDGFISRKLLKPTSGKGSYVGIVEHETEETFMAMHTSDEHRKAWAKVEPLLKGSPTPHFYKVLIASKGNRSKT